MLPLRGILRLYDPLDGELVLIARSEWFFCRAESGYHEVDSGIAIWRLRQLSGYRLERAHTFLQEARLPDFDVGRMCHVGLHDYRPINIIIAAIRDHRVVVVQRGAAPPPAKSATAELRGLVAQIDQRGTLLFQGRQYKLVLAGNLDRLSSRDRYEVVSQSAARGVLDGLAKESPASAQALGQASEKIGKDWRPPFSQPEGLVLLRRIPVPAAASRGDGPAITPSQMREMLEKGDPAEPTIRLVNVESPVFVPGVESNRISYAIDGPVAKVASVKMLVRSVPSKGDPAVVQTLTIDGPYAASGDLDWDGKALTPGGFITLRGAPYEIAFELTSKSGKVSTSNTGKISLEVQETKILVDDTGPLSVDDDWKATVAAFIAELEKSGMPGDCEGKVVIDSPLFKTNEGEMYTDISFLAYEASADTGPALPLLAAIKLKSKDGSGKRFAPALVGTRLLWDFQLETSSELDAALGTRGVAPPAKTFMKKVGAYEEAATQPKGASAHLKVGGLRAKSEDRARAGRQWQAGGDWTMTAPDHRDWAAFTGCGASASDAVADSAVYFSAGRMAGDTFKVRAVVDVDERFDVVDDAAPYSAPPARVSNVIKIVVWRRVAIVGNWIVGTTTTPVTIPPLTAEYKRAAMLIEPAPGVVPTDIEATWIKAYQVTVDAYVNDEEAFVDKALARDSQGWPVRYLDFMEYWEKDKPDAGFFGELWERIKTFFGGADEQSYKEKCEKHWLKVVKQVTRGMAIPDNGITAIKFGRVGPHNQNPSPSSYTAGVAPAIAGVTTRTKAVFFQFTLGADTKTFIHEVGHTLFLAHAPGHFQPPKQPDGYVPEAHDKDQVCLMSYHPNKMHLCGLCLLKLGGRDYRKIKNDGTLL